MSNLKELMEQHASGNEADRFQKRLRAFLKMNPHLKVLMETGAGISTLFMADGMPEDAKLYSVDSGPWCGFVLEHPNYTFINKKSIDAILDLYYQVGPFDFVLTDGSHNCKTQTYEYNVLFEFLKPGGYMLNDDTSWSNHGAFQKFLDDRGIVATQFGDCMMVQKPLEYGFAPAAKAEEVHEFWLEKAIAAQNRFYALGGEIDKVFGDD